MSRHRLYQNYDYEADLDYDVEEQEDGEEELSAEDRAQLAEATAEVKTTLGPQADKVTTKQIEEALWYYYYDVDKSVAFLINKFIDPAPKSAKTTNDLWSTRSATESRIPSNFFDDMPWLDTPTDRHTFFIAPPLRPGGLLGGTGAAPKMSRLQALAAARNKKKVEDRKNEEKVEKTEQKLKVMSLEDKRPDGRKENGEPGKRQQDEETADLSKPGDATFDTTPRKRQRVQEKDQPVPKEEIPLNKAQPSAFARTLFGSASAASEPQLQTFAPPYMAYVAPSVITSAFSQPSPDDVVLAAQSKAVGKKTANNSPPNGKKKRTTHTDITKKMDGLIVDEPLPKCKNLDVIREYNKSEQKKTMSFVVVGHVDAGKSTMMGRLLLDLKVVDQRTVDKLRKEAEGIGKSSFALAWLMDSRADERSHGVTIDIATKKFETDTTSFTILDAPGHRDFIPNMIAGASQADLAILVVDATTGAFESGLKGQTREHSQLLRSMGVSRIIVAVNKLDAAQWNKDRFDEIKQQVSGFLTSISFSLKNVAFVPLSGLNGDNLVRRSGDAAASWYTGPTLIEELEHSEPITRPMDQPLRMSISDVYHTISSPLTVSGRLDAGTLQVGERLLIQPSGATAYVKSLEHDDGEPLEWVVAGQHVVIKLNHVDNTDVHSGDVICKPSNPVKSNRIFTMKALAFDALLPMAVEVHRGRLNRAGQIKLRALLDRQTGEVIKADPRIVTPGAVCRIFVKVDDMMPLETGQRVVLRRGGETVAAGMLE